MIVVPGAPGDITAVVAGDGLSGGATSGSATVDLDLHELTAAAVADGDFIPIIDTNDSNGSRKDAVHDLATLFSGTGLTATNSVIAVDAAQTQITSVGTIATGTWAATDVGVAHGGTGASTLTANGVLIGNGTSAISSVAMATKGHILIGDGSGNPQMLGVGSNDEILVADSGETTGVKWAAASAGAVTALNNATANEIVTVGSTTTELDAESTLTFASNKLIPTPTAHDAAGTALTVSAGATTAATSNNQAGGALTFQGGQGKGSGAGGSIVFQTANAAGSGSSLNALATALTIEDDLNATFGNDVLLNTDSSVIKMGVDADATLTHDGTTGLTVAANPFEVDSGGNITLDAHTGIFIFQDANTEVLRITEGNSGDVTIKLETNAKDLIFTDNGDAVGLTIKDAAVGIVVPGEVMTTKISFTDGDDAMTVADGGGVTFAQDVTMTADMSLNLPQGANVKFTDAITQDSIDDDDHQGIIMTFTAGSTITQYSPVYLGTDDEVHECDADAIATMPAIGVSLNTSNVTDGNPIEVMLLGLIRNEDWTDFGTNGAPVFVSTSVGDLSNTAPSGDDDVVQIIGHSVGEKLLFVQPSLTYLVVDA